jgi:hypothetical protein|tara:strand:+ start:242 stop:502 length:261 start_codon:yes stop_codon:yes gene_type:complete
MDSIIEYLQCWWREKDTNVKKRPSSPRPFIKPLEDIFCSHCFIFLQNETKFKKRAQIGNTQFGFCSLECYEKWISNPSTMLIGKLN